MKKILIIITFLLFIMNINSSEIDLSKNSKSSILIEQSTGKIVNTSQLFVNVSITTIIAIAIYFLLQKNEKIKELPLIDINSLAFSTDEEIIEAQRDYAKKIYEYVKQRRI